MDPFCHNRRYRYINTSVFFSLPFTLSLVSPLTAPLKPPTQNPTPQSKPNSQSPKSQKNIRTNIQSVNPLSSTSHIVPPISPIRNEDYLFSQSSFPKTDNYTANKNRTYDKTFLYQALNVILRSVKIVEKIFRKRFVIEQSIKKALLSF